MLIRAAAYTAFASYSLCNALYNNRFLMRLLTLILILSINNLSSQELKNIDTTKSSISYSGNHFLHKWSAENNNLSGLIKIDNENILNIGDSC
jgi:hypothetical protein